MKGGNRKFNKLGVHHVYQRALDRGIIFYTVIDRLVYLSISSVKAREYGVRVLAAAIMYSHTHQSCVAETKEQLYKYIQDSSSIFARMYNRHYGLTGSLFARPFGSSLKRSAKDIKSNLAYVNNNHTEKGLCSTAIQARWNFLAYRDRKNTFYKLIESPSETLLRAIARIKRMASIGKHLSYSVLLNAFNGLDAGEREQLTDYVISAYPLVDYAAAAGIYEGFDNMLTAFDSNTGGEFALREEYSSSPDTAYTEMIALAEKNSLIGVENPPLLRFPEEKRRRMAQAFFEQTHARKFQICKFLHLPEPESA